MTFYADQSRKGASFVRALILMSIINFMLSSSFITSGPADTVFPKKYFLSYEKRKILTYPTFHSENSSTTITLVHFLFFFFFFFFVFFVWQA